MISVTDLFCGAGGSSLGAESAGMELVMAANHWQTAIEVHQAHFPDAGHDCADISQADPRRYPRTDILLASPECTNHSQARGLSRKAQQPSFWDAPDPSAERSRATMWDVPRFAEQMSYDAIVVENVVEATKWVGWRGWCTVMEDLGYERQVLSHNSMHHGVPQSRDRIYVVFTRPGINPNLELEHTAWCPRCTQVTACRQAWKNGRTVGRYRAQWEWACTTCGTIVEPATNGAEQIIDWNLDCPRIGDRKRPLAEKTRARILAGLQRYGWAPIVTAGAGNTHERTPGNRARSIDQPLAVQQATATHALATPAPFLVQTAHSGDRRPYGIDEPHPTVTASDDRLSLVVQMRGTETGQIERSARRSSDPLGVVTAGGVHHGIVVSNNHHNRARDTREPLATVTTGNRHGLVMRNQTGGAEMVTPVQEPVRTLTTIPSQSLLMPYRRGEHAHPLDEPTSTVTTRAAHALLEPDEIIDDCGFRMLQPHEIAAAMSFPDGYIPDDLTKRDRVKLAGNAVTPPVMQWICGRLTQAMEAA